MALGHERFADPALAARFPYGKGRDHPERRQRGRGENTWGNQNIAMEGSSEGRKTHEKLRKSSFLKNKRKTWKKQSLKDLKRNVLRRERPLGHEGPGGQ